MTICTESRTCLFGEVVSRTMQCNDAGQIADECWRAIPDHFPHVELDAIVIMPNHVHGIIVIGDAALVAMDNVEAPVDERAPGEVGAPVDVGAKNLSAPLSAPRVVILRGGAQRLRITNQDDNACKSGGNLRYT